MACTGNRYEVVKLLLQDPRVNPSVDANAALLWASLTGYHKIVDDNTAIIFTSKANHYKVIQILLSDPRVDPSTNNNQALRLTKQHNCFSC